MPNQPKTQHRSVRIPDELWAAAKAVALRRGDNLSDVIRKTLERYGQEERVTTYVEPDEEEEQAREAAADVEQAAERAGVSLMATAILDDENVAGWSVVIDVDPVLARRIAHLLRGEKAQEKIADLCWAWLENQIHDQEFVVNVTRLLPDDAARAAQDRFNTKS